MNIKLTKLEIERITRLLSRLDSDESIESLAHKLIDMGLHRMEHYDSQMDK